jgi:hypothetical protein
MWIGKGVSGLPLRIMGICPGGVPTHLRGVLYGGWALLLSGTSGCETGRRMVNMVCGNVVFVAERGMRIESGGSVVYSGGLMGTIMSPRMGGDSADPSRGRMRRISAKRVVRQVRRCRR